MRFLAALLVVAAACGNNGYEGRAEPRIPEGKVFHAFEPGTPAAEMVPAVEEGLSTPGHGPRKWFFIVIRAGDRHGAYYRDESFHVTVGGGVRLPEGAVLMRRIWAVNGNIDGKNDEPQKFGISLAVEAGARRPYSEKVRQAVVKACQAICERLPIHPDCILAMGEIAFANEHAADLDEKALAQAAREAVPVPPPDGALVIQTAGGPRKVFYEKRSTAEGRSVGMMFRRGFDGADRGMLFEYAHAFPRHFWMRNCRIPMDLAYINEGRIQQLETMPAAYGADPHLLPRFDSDMSIKFALEMEAGWFQKNGVKVGDLVQFE